MGKFDDDFVVQHAPPFSPPLTNRTTADNITMKDSDKKRIEGLQSWARQHGAVLHPLLEVYHDDVTKFSLRVKQSATEALDPGFAAVSCPLSTTLSYLNAVVDGPLVLPFTSPGQHTSSFPTKFMTAVPPHVIGRFFLMQQYLQGDQSFWWPYIATIPRPEHFASWALPACWSDEDIETLEGTNAYAAISEIQENLKREFKQARKILKGENFNNWQDYTRLLYNWAFCIFTSRSFRPSLIVSPKSKDSISDLLPPECGIDDFSILQPLFDIANHSMTAKYSWDITSDPKCCQLICRDVYRPGAQVFNNYGRKTNSELLLGYGFILPETEELHNDYVHLRKRADESETGQPKDFIVSLRPLTHPSSLAGRARPTVLTPFPLHLLPRFLHIEPSLVYSLASTASTPEETQIMAALGPFSQDYAPIEPPPGLEALVERICAGLTAKLGHDLERLEDSESEQTQPLNPNQALAHQYRTQCRKVLVAALQSLGSQSFPEGSP